MAAKTLYDKEINTGRGRRKKKGGKNPALAVKYGPAGDDFKPQTPEINFSGWPRGVQTEGGRGHLPDLGSPGCLAPSGLNISPLL
jgi:hypothetical protein